MRVNLENKLSTFEKNTHFKWFIEKRYVVMFANVLRSLQ